MSWCMANKMMPSKLWEFWTFISETHICVKICWTLIKEGLRVKLEPLQPPQPPSKFEFLEYLRHISWDDHIFWYNNITWNYNIWDNNLIWDDNITLADLETTPYLLQWFQNFQSEELRKRKLLSTFEQSFSDGWRSGNEVNKLVITHRLYQTSPNSKQAWFSKSNFMTKSWIGGQWLSYLFKTASCNILIQELRFFENHISRFHE